MVCGGFGKYKWASCEKSGGWEDISVVSKHAMLSGENGLYFRRIEPAFSPVKDEG